MSIPCKMNPLGEGRGGERFPLGYKRLEYLEGNSSQTITIPVYPTQDTIIETKCSLQNKGNLWAAANSTGIWWDSSATPGCAIGGMNGWLYYRYGSQLNSWGDSQSVYMNPGIKHIVKLDRNKAFVDGKLKKTFNEETFTSTRELQMFRITSSTVARIAVYWLKVKTNDLEFNVIPALDPSGRPCMFDTVTRKPFYNAATNGSDFIAGMTAKQARHLAYLPATGGNLTVSLPLAAAFDEKVQNALNKAAEKGWIFTFYWTDATEYLTPRIDAIVGEGNYTIAFNYNAQKVSLAFELSVTNEQIDEVRTLLDNELISNIVTEIDPFPIDFTSVEYLESNTLAYIQTDINSDTDIGLQVRCSFSNQNYNFIFENLTPYRSYIGIVEDAIRVRRYGVFNLDIPYTPDILTTQYNYKNSRIAKIDGDVYGPSDLVNLGANGDLITFFHSKYITKACLYAAEITKETDVVRNLIPALDNTGTPCMFDTVTRTPFYNSGTGEFTYPGAEQAVQTLALDWDAKFYAKLTEHGVRRLYHVPKGCNMSKDEYAAANEFKELIEPPAPLEGYWVPEWRETETQLICDWVETEPLIEFLEEP